VTATVLVCIWTLWVSARLDACLQCLHIVSLVQLYQLEKQSHSLFSHVSQCCVRVAASGRVHDSLWQNKRALVFIVSSVNNNYQTAVQVSELAWLSVLILCKHIFFRHLTSLFSNYWMLQCKRCEVHIQCLEKNVPQCLSYLKDCNRRYYTEMASICRRVSGHSLLLMALL